MPPAAGSGTFPNRSSPRRRSAEWSLCDEEVEGAVIGADSLVSYIMKSDVVQERDQLVDGTEGETVRSERHRTHRCRITDSDDDSATGAHHADELGEHPAGVLKWTFALW